MNNSSLENKCESCGAIWPDGFKCEEAFHQCLAWEFEEPQKRSSVHHYMVLCYHLQHPHLYSEQGLIEARKLLDAFIGGESTDSVLRRKRDLVDQSHRDWNITANSESVGAYDHAIDWQLNISYVQGNGPEAYVESVTDWAKSTHETLHKFIQDG